MAQYANIIIDISQEKLDRTFQYKIPAKLDGQLAPGMQVLVPFGNGNRTIKGYVIELTDETQFDPARIKEVIAIDCQSVPVEAQLITLAAWIRTNYGGTMSQALKTVLPIKQKTRQKEQRTITLAVSKEEAADWLVQFKKKHQTARARMIEALLETPELPYEVVTGKLNITAVVIRTLEEMGILKVESQRMWRDPLHFLTDEQMCGEGGSEGTISRQFALNAGQQTIVDSIMQDFQNEDYGTYLIHGVTGSGKTAVYIELIARAVQEGRQAIVLIPEIALTYQTVLRFYKRFGSRVSILNSRMSAGERYDQFQRAKNGELDVMIGPRSALFTPFSNLGFIIIDEEHENSYKSETIPRYHAREVAAQRAEMSGASLVLGSATPAIESYHKALSGEYRLFTMENRVEEKPLPVCEIIDLREELKHGNRSILSERLQELMEDRLEKGQQTMLFLNRRGVAGFISCRECGHVFKCPHCDISLSQHNNGRMVCHYCGYEEKTVKICPECGSKYVSGFKAGTQKIEQIVKERFPGSRVLRMDFDTTRNKEGHERILSAFANQEADILIGTQMIVKGHDFPNVTLVGILAADLSLNISDYHGPERTFQLLTQAAGRAGRGTKEGQVVIQTYSPDHYSIQLAAKQDYREFFRQEMAYRSMLKYPPVWHMMVMLIASTDEKSAGSCANLLGKKIQQSQEKGKLVGLSMIGPTDAAVAKVNDIYRKVIYFKHEDYSMLVRIKDVLEEFTGKHREFSQVTIQFDFNPMNGF